MSVSPERGPVLALRTPRFWLHERFRIRVWRYPRTAARIFFNLSTTLLGLLQDSIQRVPKERPERPSSSV